MLRALLVFLLGSIPCFLLGFGHTLFAGIGDELAWRNGIEPLQYLREYGNYHRYEAQAVLERQLREQGLVTTLEPSEWYQRYRSRTISAAWNAEESQLLTTNHAQAFRWDAESGARLEEMGAHSAAAAEDPRATGHGYTEAVFRDGHSSNVAALAVLGRHALWTHGDAARAPIVLGDQYAGLKSDRAQRVLVVGGDHVRVIDLASGEGFVIPHQDVTVAGFRPDGQIVTVSAMQIQHWRGGERQLSHAFNGSRAAYDPIALSADSSRLFAPLDDNTLGVYATDSGAALYRLSHQTRITAVCSAGGHVVTGTADGLIRLWQASDGQPLRGWTAYPHAVTLLACGRQRLLSAGEGAIGSGYPMIWRLDGNSATLNVHPPILPTIPVPWLVSVGAGLELPRRMPTVAAWLEEQGTTLMPFAIGAWVLVILATATLLRRSR